MIDAAVMPTSPDRAPALPPGVRVAYAHDWLVGMRGGERVVDRLVRLGGPGPLYTLVDDGRPMTPAIDACPRIVSVLGRVPGGAGRLRRWLLPLMPAAVDRLRVAPCDLLLSSSTCVIKGLRAPPGAVHVCYCHGPARYVWFPHDPYLAGYRRGIMGAGLAVTGGAIRRWDRRTASRVDRYVAPSSAIAGRIGACFDRDAVVVPPPVRTGFFTPDASVPREDFWLVVAALEPVKRVDIAIDAARRAGRRLVIAGDGTDRAALRRLAGDDVEFLGHCDAERVRDRLRRAALLIQPGIEDFGIAVVEALACGCPVVALGAGGALDIVDETCGALAREQTVEALVDAAARVPEDPAACRRRAEMFSEARFDERMTEVLVDALARRE